MRRQVREKAVWAGAGWGDAAPGQGMPKEAPGPSSWGQAWTGLSRAAWKGTNLPPPRLRTSGLQNRGPNSLFHTTLFVVLCGAGCHNPTERNTGVTTGVCVGVGAGGGALSAVQPWSSAVPGGLHPGQTMAPSSLRGEDLPASSVDRRMGLKRTESLISLTRIRCVPTMRQAH